MGLPMDLQAAWKEALQAISDDQFDRAVELIRQNPAIGTATGDKGETLLHEVSNCWRSFRPVQPVIRALVKAGADIEARDGEGWTPLHRAASPPGANLEALTTLIELDADVNAAIEDSSPLHLAVRDRSRVGAVALLVAHGADVHARRTQLDGFRRNPGGADPERAAARTEIKLPSKNIHTAVAGAGEGHRG